MKGFGRDIRRELGAHFEDNVFRVGVETGDADDVVEIFLFEIFDIGRDELDALAVFNLLDTIEREDGISVAAFPSAEDKPAVVELLDIIRVEDMDLRAVAVETLVLDSEDLMVCDGQICARLRKLLASIENEKSPIRAERIGE